MCGLEIIERAALREENDIDTAQGNSSFHWYRPLNDPTPAELSGS
jgi:hypothetical protein